MKQEGVERSYSAKTITTTRLSSRTNSDGKFDLLRSDENTTKRRSNPTTPEMLIERTSPQSNATSLKQPPQPIIAVPSSNIANIPSNIPSRNTTNSNSTSNPTTPTPTPTPNLNQQQGSPLFPPSTTSNRSINKTTPAAATATTEVVVEEEEEVGFTQLKASDIIYRQRLTPKKIAGRYLVGSMIGQGSFARVREAYDVNAQKIVALKIFTLRFLKRVPGGETSMKRELWALKRLPPHPNLVGLHDFWSDDSKGKCYLALDYVFGGTLRELVDRAPNKKLPLSQVKILFMCLMHGLAHMHKNGVFHRDIKSDNLMLLSERTLVITDFGTATNETSTEGVGAPAFQPPEVAKDGKAPSSAKLDVWAAGMTLYIMVTGHYPFNEHGTAYQLFEQIAQCSFTVPASVPDILANLIHGMLDQNPESRFTVEQVLKHPWLSAIEDCTDPIVIRPLKTIFTDENIKRFLHESQSRSRYELVSGDQIIDNDQLIDNNDIIDPTLRVQRQRPWWLCGACIIL